MKKIALFAALVAAGVATSNAEEAQSSYSVTLDFPYTSKYVFRGVELANSSIQPSVEVASGPIYIGVWSNQPITKHQENEFDFYLGYKHKLNDAWDVDAGATVYYYPELDTSEGAKRHTTEGYLGLNGNVKGFTPGVYTYYDFDLKATTIQGQIGYSIPAPTAGLSFDFSANVGRVFIKNSSDYSYWSFGVNVPYKINEKSTFYVGASYSNNDITGAKRDLVNFTGGISLSF
jgi:uncharacterized protein (TIGR02001 family)